MEFEEQQLAPEIWSEFPESLWPGILAFLPFSSLIKFRGVCQSWNRLIIDPSFARKCAKPPLSLGGVPVLAPAESAPVAGAAIYRCAFRTESETQPQAGRAWEKFSLGGCGEGAEKCRHLIACDGGLMLFDTDCADRYVVCNPLTRKCRELECPSKATPCGFSWKEGLSSVVKVGRIAGLVVSRETGNYKLVVVSLGDDSGDGRTTCIYDSATGTWRIGAMVIGPSAHGLSSRNVYLNEGGGNFYETFLNTGALSCNGSIYFALAKYEFERRDGWLWKVAKYHVDSDCWSDTAILIGRSILYAESPVHGVPRALPDIQLVNVDDNKVIIVSRVRNSIWLPTPHLKSVYYNSFEVLQEVDDAPMQVEGKDLPRSLIRRLLKEKEEGAYTALPCTFAGYQGWIYFTHQHLKFENIKDIEGDARVVRVGMFDSEHPESYNFLPDYLSDPLPDSVSSSSSAVMRRRVAGPIRMKIWILEPSLHAYP